MGIQPKMLDPDPDEMNADPQPCLKLQQDPLPYLLHLQWVKPNRRVLSIAPSQLFQIQNVLYLQPLFKVELTLDLAPPLGQISTSLRSTP
jgi:hypothetical protein